MPGLYVVSPVIHIPPHPPHRSPTCIDSCTATDGWHQRRRCIRPLITAILCLPPAAYSDPQSLGVQPAISPDGRYAFNVASVIVNATTTTQPVLVTDLGSGTVSAAVHCRDQSVPPCCSRPLVLQRSTGGGWYASKWQGRAALSRSPMA